MIKVLIADDHILIREGLKKILDREIGLEVVAEAETAAELFEYLRKNDDRHKIYQHHSPDFLKYQDDFYPEKHPVH